jgi:RNA polymerase sigma-70 factor (ECF subfamily)
LATDEDVEAQFVSRLLVRDEGAFNELVAAYGRRIFALVYRMLGRRDEAEDLAQEVFIHVFKSIDQFRGESKLSTWIYRIAINLCKNRMRYLSRRHDRAQDHLDSVVEQRNFGAARGISVGESVRPDEQVEAMQLEAAIREAIALVDPDFRDVMVLRDVEDLSYEEIVNITGLPTGTVKSRIHRGRAQLRELLETFISTNRSKRGE